MSTERLSEIISALTGLKLYEWKSVEDAVNREFTEMSNRLELTDVSKIQIRLKNELIH
ncbi:MAG: hypothetical protein NC548_31395 [Lachnospiraceae bacterium]|nr:hypothetical protein [Lachnospiraceae bacterium]